MILLPQVPPVLQARPSIVLLPTQGASNPKDPLRVFRAIDGINVGASEACKKSGFNVSKMGEVSATMKKLGLSTPEKDGRWPISTLLAVGKSLGVAYVGCWTDATAAFQQVQISQSKVGNVTVPITEEGESVAARWTLCEIKTGKTLTSFVERKGAYTLKMLKTYSLKDAPPIAAGRYFANVWTGEHLKVVNKPRRGS